jgi:hypothetical protein
LLVVAQEALVFQLVPAVVVVRAEWWNQLFVPLIQIQFSEFAWVKVVSAYAREQCQQSLLVTTDKIQFCNMAQQLHLSMSLPSVAVVAPVDMAHKVMLLITEALVDPEVVHQVQISPAIQEELLNRQVQV